MKNKKEWYRNRILWRAKKNKMLAKEDVYSFDEIDETKLVLVKELIKHDSEILVIIWEASNLWTALSIGSIYSFHNGELNSCKYDEIEKQICIKEPHPDASGADIKTNSEYLYLEVPKLYIWGSTGSTLMALMNLLLMFPLNFKE